VTGADYVAAIRSFLGIPYLYGGTDPRIGLDCSGLILAGCNKLGIRCPRTSEEQFGFFKPVSSPSVGDLVFFVGDPIDPPPGHVGVVTSPGTMINAPFTGTVVRYDHFSPGGQGVNRVMGYRRITGVQPSTSANNSTDTGQSPQRVAAASAGVFAGIGLFVVGFALVALAVGFLFIGGLRFAGGE
jgi:hypothetical protein